VAGVAPFAVTEVAVAEEVPEVAGVRRGERLDAGEVTLPWAARQPVAAGLEAQVAVGTERDGTVRAVYLLLDDQIPASEIGERDIDQVITVTLAGAFEVLGVGGSSEVAFWERENSRLMGLGFS
jgi:hypothetical protein